MSKSKTKRETTLPSPFMDFGQELWSADGRRMTLLIDPGRVKRGRGGRPAQRQPPFRQGKRYNLGVGGYHHEFFGRPTATEAVGDGGLDDVASDVGTQRSRP